MVHSPSSCKVWGLNAKMPRNEIKNKISPEKWWDFPLYFYLYLKIGHFSDTFDEIVFPGYFQSQISKWPGQSERIPNVSSHRYLSNIYVSFRGFYISQSSNLSKTGASHTKMVGMTNDGTLQNASLKYGLFIHEINVL